MRRPGVTPQRTEKPALSGWGCRCRGGLRAGTWGWESSDGVREGGWESWSPVRVRSRGGDAEVQSLNCRLNVVTFASCSCCAFFTNLP